MRAGSEIGVRKGGCVLETSMWKQHAAAGQPRPPPHCCFWALCWLWGEVPAELGPNGCQRVCGSPPSLCFLCGHLGSLQRTSPVSYLSVALNCFSCYPVLKHHNMSDFHLSENKVGLCFFYSRSVAVGSSGSLIPAALPGTCTPAGLYGMAKHRRNIWSSSLLSDLAAWSWVPGKTWGCMGISQTFLLAPYMTAW